MMADRLAFGPFLLLEPAVRERLAAASKTMKLEQGAILIEERQRDDDAYLLLEGSLRVVSRGEASTVAAAPSAVGALNSEPTPSETLPSEPTPDASA